MPVVGYFRIFLLGVTTFFCSQHLVFAQSSSLASLISVNDSNIFTSQDALYCGGDAPENEIYVNPHNMPDDGSVWRVGSNRWTLEVENDYSDWLKIHLSTDFFQTYNLKADCADTPTIFRMIFSRINHLPTRVTDGYSAGTLGHYSKRFNSKKVKVNFSRYPTVNNWSDDNWKDILLNKKDKRFIVFLYAVLGRIGTGTVPLNTYPIRITDLQNHDRLSEYFDVGTVLLSSGHTRMISEIDPQSGYPVKQISGSSGWYVRNLDVCSLSFSGSSEFGRGFVNWRWPVNCATQGWKFVRQNKMPGFSRQQYRIRNGDEPGVIDANFTEVIQGLAKADKDKLPTFREIKFDIKAAIEKMRLRKLLVEKAIAEQSRHYEQLHDEDSVLYHTLSSPGLDKVIVDFYDRALQRITDHPHFGEAEVMRLNLIAKSTTVEISNGILVSVYHFVQAYKNGSISEKPFDQVDARWGLEYLRSQMRLEIAQVDADIQALVDQRNMIYEKQKVKNVSLLKNQKLRYDAKSQLKSFQSNPVSRRVRRNRSRGSVQKDYEQRQAQEQYLKNQIEASYQVRNDNYDLWFADAEIIVDLNDEINTWKVIRQNLVAEIERQGGRVESRSGVQPTHRRRRSR